MCKYRFSPISVEDYEEWVGLQGKNRYIITILGRRITAEQIASRHSNCSRPRTKHRHDTAPDRTYAAK